MHLKRENWQDEVSELENYFRNVQLPNTPIVISKGNIISNVSKFIESHFKAIKVKNSNTYLPYLNRLKKLKDVLTCNVP